MRDIEQIRLALRGLCSDRKLDPDTLTVFGFPVVDLDLDCLRMALAFSIDDADRRAADAKRFSSILQRFEFSAGKVAPRPLSSEQAGADEDEEDHS